MENKLKTRLLIKNNKMDKNYYEPNNYANELIKDFIVSYDIKCFDIFEFSNFNINNKKNDNN